MTVKTKSISAILITVALLLSSACAAKTDGSIGNASDADGNVGDVTLSSGDTYAVISVKDFGDIKVKLFPDIAPVAVKNITDLAAKKYYNGLIFHRVIADFMIQGGSYNGTGTSAPDEDSFGIETNYNARHFYGALAMANAAGQNGTQFFIVNSKNKAAYTSVAEELPQMKEQLEFMKSELDKVDAGEEGYADIDPNAVYQYRAQYQTMLGQADFLENASQAVKDKYAAVGGVAYLDGGYTVFGQVVEGYDVLDAISAVPVVDDGNGNISKPATDVIIDSVTVKTY